MSTISIPRWHSKRTAESKMVESKLRDAGFAVVDAYRHNSASVRIRIIDERFRDVSQEDRDRLVESTLETLPPDTQADIINLLLMYAGEEKESSRISLFNSEFENGVSGL